MLGFVRRAISAQEVPPNQVIIGFALILTFMVMAPTWSRINSNALGPFLDEEISDEEALEIAVFELREFHQGSLALGTPIMPLVPVTCENCGNVVLISAVKAGALESNPEDPEAAGEQ